MSIEHLPNEASIASAQNWLVEHGDVLFRYALARVRDSHVAEDLVQETLLAGMVSAPRFEGNSAERTWLVGILKHKLIDHLRKSICRQTLTPPELESDSEFFDGGGHWKVRISKVHGDPREVAENVEFQRVLADCLSKLPARVAQVFWLHEAESISVQELCKELDVSPTNVWTMLHRARLRLQRCLSVNWFEGGDGK